MKSILAKIAAICMLGIIAAAVIWVATSKVKTISAEREIALVNIPKGDFQHACFAPGYYYLEETKFDVGPYPCWEWREVPEGWTYLTFYSSDGSCERTRFKADFLVRHGADYRCFSAKESEDILLSVTNGVLRLGLR